MPWGSILASVAGSVITGAMGSDAAGNAADVQARSADTATAEQRRQYDLARSDNAQYRNTGSAANRRLAQLLGLSDSGFSGSVPSGADQNLYSSDANYRKAFDAFNKTHQEQYGVPVPSDADPSVVSDRVKNWFGYTPSAPAAASSATDAPLLRRFSASDLNADPVYQSGLQFGADQGAGAINARSLATGNYDSGATLKALTRFGNDYGSTKANESYNRFNTDNTNIFNRLSGVSGTGQTATNTVTAAGSNMANNVSDLATGAGNARAAGIVGGANAWANAAGGVNSAMNNYQSNQTLQALLRRNGATPYAPSDTTGNNWY